MEAGLPFSSVSTPTNDPIYRNDALQTLGNEVSLCNYIRKKSRNSQKRLSELSFREFKIKKHFDAQLLPAGSNYSKKRALRTLFEHYAQAHVGHSLCASTSGLLTEERPAAATALKSQRTAPEYFLCSLGEKAKYSQEHYTDRDIVQMLPKFKWATTVWTLKHLEGSWIHAVIFSSSNQNHQALSVHIWKSCYSLSINTKTTIENAKKNISIQNTFCTPGKSIFPTIQLLNPLFLTLTIFF